MLAAGCTVVSIRSWDSKTQAYKYSGMSMRLAFDLGLHIDMTQYVSKGDISPHEADVRRAAFWGSYVADQ